MSIQKKKNYHLTRFGRNIVPITNKIPGDILKMNAVSNNYSRATFRRNPFGKASVTQLQLGR